MKRFIYTLMALLILITNLPGQWEILNQAINGNLNSIDFVNERIGWMGGSDGLLLKTEDSGQTWISLQQNANWDLCLIDFFNELLGWAAVDDGTTGRGMIIKTTDGGQTWTIQIKYPNISTSSITVVDERVVYAIVNSNSRMLSNIIKTSDGGASWEFISPNKENRYFQSIQFVNSNTGFVAGCFYRTIGETTFDDALILKTENGGESWTEKINSELFSIGDLQFINDSTAFFKSGGLLYKTEDAFESWPTSPLNDSTAIDSYHALYNDKIYAIADGVMKSTDGGRTWEKKLPINWRVDKIYFCSPQVGFLIGGDIVRSVDSGDQWQTQFWIYPFKDVCFIDKDKGFASGGSHDIHDPAGNIFVTYNGGKNWEEILRAIDDVRTCHFINDLVGFAFIGGGYGDGAYYLFKTEDSGKSWMENYAFNGCDLFFVNEKIGWTIGDRILCTTDGGESWTESLSSTPDRFTSIYMLDHVTGWAVGDNGLIVKCTDGSHWEEMKRFTDLPLKKIFFVDDNNGYIAGGYLNDEDNQAILFKTTNGGEAWGKIPDFPYLIHDIYFHDTQHGWAIGTDKSGKGVIVETQDGGDFWAMQMDSLIGSLNALSYRDNFLWAVGDYGLVLRTTVDSGTRIDAQPGSAVPPICRLAQNYPNPFNATTAISYQLSAVNQVELSIYTLLGQRVATLVSAKQAAGSYKVEWDGAEFSSGLYFCRLEAVDPSTSSPNESGQAGQSFVKVIKLALIK